MSIKAQGEPFVEDFVELGLQSEDVADAGRGWRHPFGLLLFEFEEIEVVTAVRNFLGASKGFFGRSEEGAAGGKVGASLASVGRRGAFHHARSPRPRAAP